MRAWLTERFGGPEVLRPAEVPSVPPGPNDVLIRIAYCGICRHDLLTRAGAFPEISLPVILGHQVSGYVEAVGAGVGALQPGERVMTMIYTGCGECVTCRSGNQGLCLNERPSFLGEDADGGYAEFVTVRADTVLPMPDGVSLGQAAVIMCTLGTAFHALTTRAALQGGETVVITGASGGVGQHAVQIAKHLGATVLGVTTSESKAPFVRAAGADHAVVAEGGEFRNQVKELTSGRGADAVIEIVGSQTLTQSIHSVRSGGRVVIVGNVDGQPGQVKPAHFILKEISLIGTKASTFDELSTILDLVAGGKLSIEVEETVPFESVPEAHARIEAGQASGRLVMQVGGERSR